MAPTIVAFGTPTRTPAQVSRFVSFNAPEFRGINLGPTGVTQTAYADLAVQVVTFPAFPYTMTNVRTVAINTESAVMSYQVTPL